MPTIVRFDCYEVDLAAGQLLKRGARIHLREQCFQVLALLVTRAGHVVTREDLRRQLWPDHVFVDFDNSLNTAVARLREVLNDSAERPRFIETLPRRGYRFIADVQAKPSMPARALVARPRLVVLPFINLAGDPAEEHFADAMTDELITALAALAPERLAVIARTTAMHYKESRKDVAQIARDLHVDYVVEGGVRRAEHDVAISVQLVQGSDQTHVFARKYEAPVGDLGALHDCIALAIAGCIPSVSEAVAAGRPVREAVKAKGMTRDPIAYDEYSQGRYQVNRGMVASFAAAKEHLERAIARDPGFVLPFDALAEMYWYQGYYGFMRPRDAFAAGIVHAVRALEIDDTRAETHALLGQFHKAIEYNWPEVDREMQLALRLDPASPLVRMRYAVSGLMPHGRIDEAIVELERALEVDPLNLLARFWLAIVLILGRRYDRAVAEGRTMLEIDPTVAAAYFAIHVCHRIRGEFDEAIAVQRKAVEVGVVPEPIMLGWLGMALAEAGRDGEARVILQQLHAMATQRYVSACSIAWIHLGLKEIDVAFEWLERAVDECDQILMPIKTYRFFDPFRSDPRFATLLRRMNLQA